MRCRFLLAALALAGAVSFAQAQQVFAPKPIDPTPIASATPAPLPANIAPIIPASARVAQAGCSNPVVAYGEGCSAAPAHPRTHSLLGKILIGGGTRPPDGCGCTASEKTFVFGSCRQFFTPQKDCPGGGCCGNGGCWAVDRRPPGLGVTSYLNR